MPSLIASLGLNISRFMQGLRQAEGEAKKHGHSIAKSLGEGMSEKLVEFGSAVAIEESIRRTVEYADKIGDMAKRTSVAAEALQAWDQALKLSGSSIEEAIPFFEKLAVAKQKALKGDEDAIEAFSKFGISIAQLKSKRVEDLGLDIAKAFKTGDPQALIANLREVGGKGAGAMIAAFREGLAEKVEGAMGSTSIIPADTIDKIKEAADEVKSFLTEIRAGLAQIVAGPLGAMASALVYIKDLIGMNAAALGGFSVGGFNGARKAAADYQAMINARAAAKKEEKKEPFDRDQESESISKRKQLEEMEKRLREKIQSNDIQQLSSQQRLLYLEKQRLEVLNGIANAKSKKEVLEGLGQLEDIKKEAFEAGKLATQTATPHNKDLNTLQQIGAYTASPEQVTAIDLSRRQERHLDAIRKNMEVLANKAQSTGEGVKF